MIFFSDLDNTLIHSYNRKEEGDICIEVRDGKELSFMSPKAYELLQEVNALIEVVPITTRTVEQYNRLSLIYKGAFRFALVCNGAVLLHNGEPDAEWLNETRTMYCDSLELLSNYAERLSNMPERFYDVRIANDFFIFAKRVSSESSVEQLKDFVDAALFDVHDIFKKVYVMPKRMDKGAAARRFLKLHGKGRQTISAGDSILDLPLLRATDRAFAPVNFPTKDEFIRPPDEGLFAEYILKSAISISRSFEP